MDKKTGGPAYPRPGWPNAHEGPQEGMMLRDYFAGQALQPFMDWKLSCPADDVCYDAESAAIHYAKTAYIIADAMIAEREK